MSVDYKLLQTQVTSVGIALMKLRDNPFRTDFENKVIDGLEGAEELLSYILEEKDSANLTPVDESNSREDGAHVANEHTD